MQWIFSENYIEYLFALDQMKQRVQEIIHHESDELIWFLEHFPVYTAGSSANENELINKKNFPIVEVGRGGKYTYHGPGQRVVYFMLDLKKRNLCDLKKYIFLLEEIIIDTLSVLNIKGYRKPEYIGVWVKHNNVEKKIAAIGVRITKWVTYHGIAININPDLSHYDGIIPCGIKGFLITSLADIEKNITLKQFDKILQKSIEAVLI